MVTSTLKQTFDVSSLKKHPQKVCSHWLVYSTTDFLSRKASNVLQVSLIF